MGELDRRELDSSAEAAENRAIAGAAAADRASAGLLPRWSVIQIPGGPMFIERATPFGDRQAIEIEPAAALALSEQLAAAARRRSGR